MREMTVLLAESNSRAAASTSSPAIKDSAIASDQSSNKTYWSNAAPTRVRVSAGSGDNGLTYPTSLKPQSDKPHDGQGGIPENEQTNVAEVIEQNETKAAAEAMAVAEANASAEANATESTAVL